MSARTIQLRRRELAVFLFVAALLGVLVASCGSGGQQLSLSLSVTQQICETEAARIYGGSRSYQDEDGSWVEEETIYGWWRIPSVPVKWRVRGGQWPYRLEIDHEAADQYGDYEGASGTAQVGCADASVGTSFWPDPEIGRMYAVDPQVDSGWKTIQAVVTDANGDTTEATVDVYVVLVNPGSDRVLRGGQTYRIYGHLITVPDAIDMWCCEAGTGHPRGVLSFFIEGYGAAYVVLDRVTFEEVQRWLPPADVQRAEGVNLDAKLDAFVDSIDQLPDPNGSVR